MTGEGKDEWGGRSKCDPFYLAGQRHSNVFLFRYVARPVERSTSRDREFEPSNRAPLFFVYGRAGKCSEPGRTDGSLT
jgi:hypothetical protein